MKHKKVMLWALLGLILAATVAGITAVLLPARFINYDVMSTAVVVGLYGVGGLILVSIAGGQRRLFQTSAAALALSMAVFVFGIWTDGIIDWLVLRWVGQIGSVVLFLGLLLAHRMLVAPLPAAGMLARVTQRASLISAALLFLLSSVGMVNDGFWGYEEIAVRLLVIFGIVVVGSTIATGALAYFGPRPGEDEPGAMAGSIVVRLDCPRCDAPIEARANTRARCGACRLKVRVEIEEPRCSCGYLLYQLVGATCPECGRVVSEEDRWESPSSAQPA